eukprot:CAMPEP_0170768472 /NCGR_PEP_ID=MMETSP0733-20121128/6421_1 /TAXON_ID=186038 /ORGANISM="Fragilariopsis kerguelensis, Strain L26-C5" /LENGTH=267 /DNA_ID=CAMNT_0011109921 /DNA_START=128 /DNA_END=927 /DNA_ORIENTATION=-
MLSSLILPFITVLLLLRLPYSEAFIIGGRFIGSPVATIRNKQPRVGSSISVLKSYHNKYYNNGDKDNDNDDNENIRRLLDDGIIITNDSSVDDDGENNSFTRRDALRNGFLLSTVGLLSQTFTAEHSNAAATTATENKDQERIDTVDHNNNTIEYDCLQDLPPISSNSIRLYLCRHGQTTENNRLRIAQGSRVDPPINNNGIKQGTNLGVALSFVPAPKPELFFSSSLRRAQMTAHLAAEGQRPSRERPRSPRQLSVLAEVDFGSFV